MEEFQFMRDADVLQEGLPAFDQKPKVDQLRPSTQPRRAAALPRSAARTPWVPDSSGELAEPPGRAGPSNWRWGDRYVVHQKSHQTFIFFTEFEV